MATSTISDIRSRARGKFNKGCNTLHADEIQLGKDLHTACILIYGKDRSRRIVEKSPAAMFRRMRYGRRVLNDANRPTLCLVSDNSEYMHWNKAEDRHIFTPFSRRWNEIVERVRQVSLLPRWADGWTATAETLDDLGYAIAESIAALLCCGIDSDEMLVCHESVIG